jgi:hypothetical protein
VLSKYKQDTLHVNNILVSHKNKIKRAGGMKWDSTCLAKVRCPPNKINKYR